MLIRQKKQQKDIDSQTDEKSFDAYEKEHNRLEALRDESESIWEERTYQIAAGGLSLTFAVFSFLMSRNNGMAFSWQMAVIWAGFAFCLVVNYLSQRISIKHFEKLQKALLEDRVKNVQYNEEGLIERNRNSDILINVLNCITEIVLVVDIIFTIIYICVLFSK